MSPLDALSSWDWGVGIIPGWRSSAVWTVWKFSCSWPFSCSCLFVLKVDLTLEGSSEHQAFQLLLKVFQVLEAVYSCNVFLMRKRNVSCMPFFMCNADFGMCELHCADFVCIRCCSHRTLLWDWASQILWTMSHGLVRDYVCCVWFSWHFVQILFTKRYVIKKDWHINLTVILDSPQFIYLFFLFC